jgi:hypothetical protein
MGEPHLDALAFAARLLEGLGADPRPSHVTGALIDAARDPSKRRLRTASRFEVALGAVHHAAAIEDRVPGVDPARRRQRLAGWADSDKEALTIAKGMFEGDPWMGGFELWLGPRRVAAETRAPKPGKKKALMVYR